MPGAAGVQRWVGGGGGHDHDHADGSIYQGRIYVKGMVVVGAESSGRVWGGRGAPRQSKFASLFGYNLKEFEVVSRDRQGTMEERDKKREICKAWSSYLFYQNQERKRCLSVAGALFEAIREHPECLEAAAIRENFSGERTGGNYGAKRKGEKSSLDGGGQQQTDGEVVKHALMDYFEKKYGSNCIPFLNGHETTRANIWKLGKQPMGINHVGRNNYLH